ncbi:hypothetical protein HYFRA_00002377 [Hymenoscyphus fraxineus]|uniref:HCNGP-domain-containing protein n=1 Tax=Hymenoscyphus fraxineus TaxID=746836 RepID=A0A9N9LAU5_9HELO|nr:hypothetical protein HYFRA_00002377 [Hymenoscyphus fraxineus]
MAGLVDYGSSDEEEESDTRTNGHVAEVSSISGSNGGTAINTRVQQNGDLLKSPTTLQIDTPKPDEAAGPILGPTIPASDADMEGLLEDDQEVQGVPQSPYSANRALLRDLTLPTIPNYDIPASPPGSPVASTNKKFKHFLELKKKGVHFNEKLAKSSALKNPALMQKLMDFAEIDEAGQYSTTLANDCWDPNGFPNYAFKEELGKSQKAILKRKEDEKARGQREAVDFVPASGDSTNRSATHSVGGKGAPKSTAERIMAGLESDRGRSNSPQVHGIKRKSRFDS